MIKSAQKEENLQRNEWQCITSRLADGRIRLINWWKKRTVEWTNRIRDYRSWPRPAEAGQAGVCRLVDEWCHDLLRHVCEDSECRDNDEVDEPCVHRKADVLNAAGVSCVNARITELPFETQTEWHLHIQLNQNQIQCSHCSPIWDWATMVDLRSHNGEKGNPSSASLSP